MPFAPATKWNPSSWNDFLYAVIPSRIVGTNDCFFRLMSFVSEKTFLMIIFSINGTKFYKMSVFFSKKALILPDANCNL